MRGALATKQSRLPPWKDPGLLRCARNDGGGSNSSQQINRRKERPFQKAPLPPVIARSPCDEAIQTAAAEKFWIASLRSQ
ncbi:hypothetical protein EAS62_07315 [Bradyrhizobium zhanjiangense]|uniref:Uncharacterized protein n=1 Tax=Bradyrhizobium zhanjiangense TaxID=1325107 RepID=A0ABY0DS08_9BRAD|nr:hypothetical protein EAS62_07315 [Bradyrhizobium zhanjiangense]